MEIEALLYGNRLDGHFSLLWKGVDATIGIHHAYPIVILDAKDEAELRADAARWRAVRALAERTGHVWLSSNATHGGTISMFGPSIEAGANRETLDAAADALIAALDVGKATTRREGRMSDKPLLVLDLQAGAASGWNIFSLNLAKHALSRCRVGLTVPPKLAELNDADAVLIATLPVYEAGDVPPHAITVTGLGNGGANRRGGWPVDAPDRKLNVGVIFSEDTAWKPAEVALLNTYDLIVAGSTWNADVLKANGVRNVVTVFQGVDLDIFYPDRSGSHRLLRQEANIPFRVFSGGKLEYRKGQDIVVAAFREFHAAHPNSQLVVAWDNHWPSTMQDISVAGHTVGAPVSNADIPNWLRANGVTAFENVGMRPHYVMGNVLRSCDVAVFSNRAEGGTNLVAMEAIACDLPTILSRNTGHNDVVWWRDPNEEDGQETTFPIYDLDRQRTITAPVAGYSGTDGWGESDPSDIAQLLASLYRRHLNPPSFATPPIAWMDGTDWSWPLAIGRLLDACGVER